MPAAQHLRAPHPLPHVPQSPSSATLLAHISIGQACMTKASHLDRRLRMHTCGMRLTGPSAYDLERCMRDLSSTTAELRYVYASYNRTCVFVITRRRWNGRHAR